MGVPPMRIDLLMGIPGVKFDEAWSGRVMTDVDGLQAEIAGLNYFVFLEELKVHGIQFIAAELVGGEIGEREEALLDEFTAEPKTFACDSAGVDDIEGELKANGWRLHSMFKDDPEFFKLSLSNGICGYWNFAKNDLIMYPFKPKRRKMMSGETTTESRKRTVDIERKPVSSEPKDHKTICIPLDKPEYQELVDDPSLYRVHIDNVYATYPELFPLGMNEGYTLHDKLPYSIKLPDVRLSRIRLKSNGEVYTLRPSSVLPFMVGYTNDVENGLLLLNYGVPY